MMKDTRHFDDIRFSVVAEWENDSSSGEYPITVNFRAYQITGTYENGQRLWSRKDSQSWPDDVENLDDAELYLHGFVIWDGCSNWNIDAQDGIMLHECDRSGLVAIGEVMARCWDWGKELMPTFDQ